MLGAGHRLFGGLAGAAYATALGQPAWQVCMTSLVATATSNGPTSPDMDQTDEWRTWTKAAPKAIRRHRGITHWWGLPALGWLCATELLPPEGQWPAYALLVGWISHVVGDAIFGKIPLSPWGMYVGLGLDTGGFLETGTLKLGRWTKRVLPFGPFRAVTAVALVWLLIGAPGLGDTSHPAEPPAAKARTVSYHPARTPTHHAPRR